MARNTVGVTPGGKLGIRAGGRVGRRNRYGVEAGRVYTGDELAQGIAREDVAKGKIYEPTRNASGSGLRGVRPNVAAELARLGNSIDEYDARTAASAAGRAAEGNDRQTRELRSFSRYLRVHGAETRDLSTATSSGGYLIPQSMEPGALFGVRYASAFLGGLRLWKSTSPITGKAYGGPATFPLITSDVNTQAGNIGDNTLIGNNDPVLAKVTFPQAPEQSFELFRVSRMLLQDSNVPILDLLNQAIAERVARFMDSIAVTNLLAAATLNQTTASTGTVVYSDVVNWVEKLSDISIMGSPTSCIVVSPSTLKQLRLMVDNAAYSNRPIMGTGFYTVDQDNLAAEFFDGDESYSRTIRVPTLLGIPVLTSNALAAFGAGNVVGIAGDLQQAGIYRHVEMSVQTLWEKYGDYGQVAYLGFYRGDVQAGDVNAYATLTIHA